MAGPRYGLPAGDRRGQAVFPVGVHVRAGEPGTVIVEVDNRSGGDLCTYRGVSDPYFSWGQYLQLRPRGGKPLKVRNPGYLPAPQDGLRITPGHSVLGHYALAYRFESDPAIEWGRWEAKAGFRFHRCGDTDWQDAESVWESL